MGNVVTLPKRLWTLWSDRPESCTIKSPEQFAVSNSLLMAVNRAVHKIHMSGMSTSLLQAGTFRKTVLLMMNVRKQNIEL
ncbi:MAG: hypothetical protein A4E52_00059 [Pelotomaculum sp. PtaB.Bin013]|uniref:Uncharacterized protein n=1 Tax=Pelotomaculum isophthalicicum JI TaxID=947010 RepID=A0A9X4JWN2_9FIRM|nr:hypothetical protein [Pelotomaculum isophthalicicum]MDF9409508.1 hypothetical protein [Pelotomaculum isophthalicicum JI]OPX92193.1 MAG: hypothetical protein A4E52_00059 [Pelotomaculum sp. PtaB.Bin013]